jgi:5,5'-dehydrodivanillate O-demethylase oxygenase subunit
MSTELIGEPQTNGWGSSQAPATPHISDFAFTGPDTLAGKYMRLFWHPVYLARQLLPGKAVPLRVMSDDYTLFRGTGGVARIIAFRCAHRGTQLSTGTVEGNCVRCRYHGWKFDGDGQCVEQPAEKSSFAAKVSVPAYPTREYLGMIWAYFGPGEPPEFRRFHQLESEGDDGVRMTVGGNAKPYNYVNDLENDPAHVPFVHAGTEFFTDIPEVSTEETPYGARETVTTEERGQIGWVHRIFPNARCFAITLPHGVWVEFILWLVPIDDSSHKGFGCVMAHREGGRNDMFIKHMRAWEGEGGEPDDAPEIAARILRGEAALEDLPTDADMRARRKLLNVQDAVVQMGQGTIRDRVHERLGRSDIGVILLRKIWDRELRALVEGRPLKEWVMPERFELDKHYHEGHR